MRKLFHCLVIAVFMLTIFVELEAAKPFKVEYLNSKGQIHDLKFELSNFKLTPVSKQG